METLILIIFIPVYASILIAIFFIARNKSTKKEKVRDWLTKEEAEAFTGENGAYYLDKWKDRQDSFLKGWNWAAAFFFVEWLAYKKMYDRSFFMLPGIWVGIRPRSVPLAVFIYLGLSHFLDNWLAIPASIWICRFIGGGLFGNMVYRDAALERLKKSLHMNEPERLAYLKSKGGTNPIAPVIAVIVQAVGIIVLIVFCT